MSAIDDTLWIAPHAIRFKISPVHDLHGTVAGDWDIERRHLFADTVKHRAMVQRFTEGRPWIETDLFVDTYTRRLKNDGHIGGLGTLNAVAERYHIRFDAMAEQMRRDGFRLNDKGGRPHALPAFLIGRDGEVMIGNQGNHRLALAKVLGLSKIAGKIVCRHRQTV